MASGQPPLLQVDNLAIGIPADKPRVQVRGVTFALKPGETLGIVGESGSGKTLTACSVCGLLPRPLRILEGGVCFDGRRINPSDPKKSGFRRGRDLLMLFQSPLGALDPTATVGRQLAETLRAAGKGDRRTSDRLARGLMKTVGLDTGLFHRYPFQLSGGQRQRVLLSMAFGLRPRVLIADEPTAGQDDESRDQIFHLLDRLQRTAGTAAVIITHDLRIVARLAEKIVVLYRGQQVETGPTAAIFNRPVHPHTQELVEAMKYLKAQR
jgi:ABC-type glutathione transport system ATPase component